MSGQKCPMTPPRRILLIAGIAVALCTAVYLAFPIIALGFGVRLSVREQQARNDSALPLVEAVVAKRIKVGASADEVQRVLADAGLGATYNEFDKRWESIYRTGRQSGITIEIYVDSAGRASRVKLQPVMTGP